MRLCFDSDVLVEALRDDESPSADLVRKVGDGEFKGFVTFVTVAELYVGVYLTGRTGDVESLLNRFERLRINDSVARKAGEIKAETGLTLPDCLIGSNALLEGLTLTTRNVKRFSKIEELEVESPEDLL